MDDEPQDIRWIHVDGQNSYIRNGGKDHKGLIKTYCTCEYLGEIKTKFENTLAYESKVKMD